MFILDDLLAAPFKGVMWILKEVVAAAEEEQAAESDRIKDRLRELYMLLETGQMTEAEFEAEESSLLDRLDELEQSAGADDQESRDDDDDADAEDDDDADDDADDSGGSDYTAAGDDRADVRAAGSGDPPVGVSTASAPAGTAAKDRPGDGD